MKKEEIYSGLKFFSHCDFGSISVHSLLVISPRQIFNNKMKKLNNPSVRSFAHIAAIIVTIQSKA